MAKKTNRPQTKKIAAKAQRVLEFAQELAKAAADWLEVHFAVFGADGKASELFPTESERAAFLRTAEYKQLLSLLDSLPRPSKSETREVITSANGAISMRLCLPRSVHAALLVEADAEGVSLNQLCVAKLVAQLRAVV